MSECGAPPPPRWERWGVRRGVGGGRAGLGPRAGFMQARQKMIPSEKTVATNRPRRVACGGGRRAGRGM